MSFILGIKTNAHSCSEVHQENKDVNESEIKDIKATVNLIDGINVVFANYIVTFAGYSAKVFIFY